MISEGNNRQLRRPEAPRRVRHGIRLKRKNGVEGLPAGARTWLDLVEGQAVQEARLLGLEYALAGQVASLSFVPGAVEAMVQGRAPRPYSVRLASAVLERREWDSVVESMAAEAIYSAKLLAGELPASIEAPFARVGRTLVPTTTEELTISCQCGDPLPCKHCVAVAYLAAERIEVDPLVLFGLRGLPGERLLERLQEARAVAGSGSAGVHSAPASSAPGGAVLPPIEACISDFWRPGRTLSEFDAAAPASHAPHALLRRLGPSPLGGRFPLVGLLASAYDTIRQHALQLRQRGSE